MEATLATPVLTHKQHAMLECIQRYFERHRRSPLIREIQADCQIASYKSAIDRFNALEHKGLIRRLPHKHRGIRLARMATASPLALSAATLPGRREDAAHQAPQSVWSSTRKPAEPPPSFTEASRVTG